AIARTRFVDSGAEPLARAQVAGMGVASGAIALDSAAAKQMADAGKPVILVRRGIETGDIGGMMSAAGILTASGGRTSHAAVIARQLGKVCLVGCPELSIDLGQRCCRVGRTNLHEGESLSLDGNGGGVYAGEFAVIAERPERELAQVAAWRDSQPGPAPLRAAIP
ncbi:MAG TPA: PEP-utilizing enzyme, partial [Bryobacteraceae bacterium]|nr:PEP-utilizing enzyme [Bryobacteraceae bacterium]